MAVENLGRITGKSAYELAVEHGYVGTEKQWVRSIVKGEKGANGKDGTVGLIDGKPIETILEQKASVQTVNQVVSQLADKASTSSVNSVVLQLADKATFKEKATFLQNTIKKMQKGEVVKIIMDGDSTVDSSTANGYSNPRYYDRVQTVLNSYYDVSNITVKNNGVGGRTSKVAVTNIRDYQELCDLRIICFGINDANPLFNDGETIAEYKENISILVENALKKGSEVLLVSPSPVFIPDFDRNKTQKFYARAVKDVASKYQVAFYDMEYHFSELISKGVYNMQDLVDTDFVHKTSLGYTIMADLVARNLLNSDLIITDNTTIPARRSPYLLSTATNITSDINDKYKHYASLTTTDLTQYLKFNFVITEANLDLILISPLRATGGQIKYTLDGIESTLDFYSPKQCYNAEFVIAKNLSVGYHRLIFESSKITAGQSPWTEIYAMFSAFQFRKNVKDNTLNFNTDGIKLNVLKYKKVIGEVEFSNNLENDKASLFGEYIQKGDLTFITRGRFNGNTGIFWYGKDNISLGYMLRFHSGQIFLYDVKKENNGADYLVYTELGKFTGATDYTKDVTFKVTHTKVGLITVYMDGVQIITLTDTKHRSGYFGVFAHNNSAKIYDLQYDLQ